MNDAAILINVDDVEAERSARNIVLSNAGFLVHDAATAPEALDLVEQHHPALVVVHLSDRHGIEICRRLKLRDAPVGVLQVGSPAAVSFGADASLPGPVDAGALVAMIRALLRLRDAEGALAECNARLDAAHHEIRRSNEDFQQFAYCASHDLKEGVRMVSTFSELLDQEARSRLTEAEKGYVTHVMAGANRIRGLIDDLLDYSRISPENQTCGAVGMSAVVAWAIADLDRQVSEAGATIQVAERLPKVWGDFAQLGQVIRNLLSNAIKFRKPDVPPVVDIGVQEPDPQQCLFSVRDNGIGIAPEYREKIFAPFKRLHGHEIPGTGMGLAVCRRIVNLHGGSIWVESEPHRGSSFFLRLPSATGMPKLQSR